MRLSTLALSCIVAGASIFSLRTPALCEYDGFELAPGIEQTRIPRRLSPSRPLSGVNAQDSDRIERLRAAIERCYKADDYAAAEPLYKEYSALIERVAPGDPRAASALQNYAELLRKLHRDDEAKIVEARARVIIGRSEEEIRPFGIKQYKLGMALDEFTRMPPPGLPGKVKVVCSCDPGQTVEVLTELDKNVKVLQCGFWNVQGKDGVGTPYKMTVADIPCRPDFRFIQTDDGTRLFEISLTFFASNYDDMKGALLGRYGKPKEERQQKLTTEMGNIFLKTSLIWDNGVSKIGLINADGTNTGTAKLRYVQQQLYTVYAHRMDEEKHTPLRRAEEDL